MKRAWNFLLNTVAFVVKALSLFSAVVLLAAFPFFISAATSAIMLLIGLLSAVAMGAATDSLDNMRDMEFPLLWLFWLLLSIGLFVFFFALCRDSYFDYCKKSLSNSKFFPLTHTFHDWNGCKCRVCGKVREVWEKGHDWDGKTCVSKCRICGKTRGAKTLYRPSWWNVEHNWDGCKCRLCGKTRNEGHDWDDTKCHCRRCGKENHAWELMEDYRILVDTEIVSMGSVDLQQEERYDTYHYYRKYICSKCHVEKVEDMGEEHETNY